MAETRNELILDDSSLMQELKTRFGGCTTLLKVVFKTRLKQNSTDLFGAVLLFFKQVLKRVFKNLLN